MRVVVVIGLLCLASNVCRSQSSDTTRVDTSNAPYRGYKTWQEYLHHQDSLPVIQHDELKQWLWIEWGIGNITEKTNTDGLLHASLFYERNSIVFTGRFIETYYAGKNSSTNDQLKEVDAMAGIGFFKPISANLTAGVGYRKYAQRTIDEMYTPEYSLAVPVQLKLFFQVPDGSPSRSFVGLSLSAYGTYTRTGFDYGFIVSFVAGWIGSQ